MKPKCRTRCSVPYLASIFAMTANVAFAQGSHDRAEHAHPSPSAVRESSASPFDVHDRSQHEQAGEQAQPDSHRPLMHMERVPRDFRWSRMGAERRDAFERPSAVRHSPAGVPTESERRHVPPDPPTHPMPEISNGRMIELMGMDDGAAQTMLMLDQFEWRDAQDANVVAWDVQAWFGDDYNRAWFKSEGSRDDDEYESQNELLWDRIVSRWWSLQAGLRHDVHQGPSRTWAAVGIQGLAPHWWEVDAMAYVGAEGRTALRMSAEVDLLLTQRLVLQPELELHLYGKDDARNAIGSGLSSTEVGLRMRYEVRREVAPYIGAVWVNLHGGTADLARLQARDTSDVQFVAGIRLWF